MALTYVLENEGGRGESDNYRLNETECIACQLQLDQDT